MWCQYQKLKNFILRSIVTLILGSTLVFVKMALNYLAPLTIAAGRYCLAFTILLPFMVRRTTVSRFPNSLWIRFFLIGLSFYVIGNGALFWGLKYIPRVLCC